MVDIKLCKREKLLMFLCGLFGLIIYSFLLNYYDSNPVVLFAAISGCLGGIGFHYLAVDWWKNG